MSRKTAGRTHRHAAGPPSRPLAVAAGPNPLLAQADALCRRGQLEAAEALVRNVLSGAPRDHAALHMLGIIMRQKGDSAAAIDLFRRAIAISGRIASYHGNLGNAYFETAKFEEAARCYRRALALEPGSALAHFGLGVALMAQKAYAAAITELEAAAKIRPDHADTHLNLGIALSELGRIDEAIAHYQRAVALNPNYAVNHVKLGVALRAKGELERAYAHLARAVELDPAEAYYEFGNTCFAPGRLDEAVRALRQALTVRPERIDALDTLGKVLLELDEYDEAIGCYERMLALAPQSALPYRGLGQALLLQGRFAEARAAFTKALEREPENGGHYARIGRSYWSEGRFEEAIVWHEKALARQPDNAEAHYALAMMRSARDRKERIRELERLLALGLYDWEQCAALNFALAKMYDEQGDYDTAFRYFKAGNDLHRARNRYRPEAETAYVDRVIATFSKELFAAKGRIGNRSERPVFVVGLPRSGTTLVGQILASHPRVHGHGELAYMHEMVQALPKLLGSGEPYPECVAALDSDTAERLAEAYLARLERDAGDAIRSVDKMPDNFMRLGLIALLFPQARVINCVRDPLDTCLSCYFHDFGRRNAFARDLDHLGRYYRDYQRIMAHWRATLTIPILDVPYEALVGEQELWSRKLIDFLGLPWDERCLAFYETKRPVFTSSAWQVRQPIYTSSIGRWRHYAKHLGPLFSALGIAAPC
jgi:tetratricopeptide (TPR) repeat protein